MHFFWKKKHGYVTEQSRSFKEQTLFDIGQKSCFSGFSLLFKEQNSGNVIGYNILNQHNSEIYERISNILDVLERGTYGLVRSLGLIYRVWRDMS